MTGKALDFSGIYFLCVSVCHVFWIRWNRAVFLKLLTGYDVLFC